MKVRVHRQEDEQEAAGHNISRLVDDYRDTCLWFLRQDYYPSGKDEILRVLRNIERHGDRDGYARARETRQWVLQHFNEKSAGS